MKSSNILKFFLQFIFVFYAMDCWAEAQDTLTIHYVDRPPYALSGKNDVPSGVVADPASLVLKRAGIPFVWAKTPVNRQFAIIKDNKGFDCSLGMEQTARRSAFAKFSDPLYISEPLVAIANPTIKVTKTTTFAEMLQKHSILIKENYTLGDELTALAMKSLKKQTTASESVQMVQMIAKGRADFMMISNDELGYYIRQGIIDRKEVRIYQFPDAKKSFTRRLMCSKSIKDLTLNQINKAIKELNVQPLPLKNLSEPGSSVSAR